ncbi:MAG: tRNA uridine 5-carboxymethylaminomethyl modification enzyme, partial [Planctomycetota bacterium]
AQAAAGGLQAKHSHPRLDATDRAQESFDVVVVGGGHAGIEAALAAARLGASVALVSFRADLIGEMSCNPAIGGLGKGQIVREVDALGGAMGRIADATGIQFRMLNTRKGAAVRAPRCQSDRHLYREAATALVREQDGVTIVEGAVTGMILAQQGDTTRVAGVSMGDGRELRSGATILTTGTFLRAVMHTGQSQESGGRVGESSADRLSADIERLQLKLGRLKTGTPPRLTRDSIDWEQLEEQHGDEQPQPFSHATVEQEFPTLPQIACHITYTGEATHQIIRDNIGLAPMYAGRIQGVGPRYCPSVEDKVMRFADKDRHQLFLEPESLSTDAIYANGVSTSLPAEVQQAFVRTIPGLERAEFLRFGYAVEYDFVLPSQLDRCLAVRHVPGLYLAGQINGTSGYEEAAGQGLIAGTNAALWLADRAPFTLARHEAYIGVLVDDLIVTNPSEPYRMFSSRAEFRLLLRQDNADQRLTRLAADIGLAHSEDLARLKHKEQQMHSLSRVLSALRADDGKTLAEVLRRPEVRLSELISRHPELAAVQASRAASDAVETDLKYAGYVRRQLDQVERLKRQEAEQIPGDVDFASLTGLASEAIEKLTELRPATLGAASRIAGVRPPDVALLGVHLERLRRARSGVKS